MALSDKMSEDIDLYLCFFFCKQKSAYEMRISDWSSDVCSSDLDREAVGKAWRHLLVEEARPLGCGDRGAAGALGAEVELQACHGKEIGRASCRERVCQYV